MYKEMKGLQSITEEDLISWLSSYAEMIIQHFDTPSELLKYLNWDENLGPMDISIRILELFEKPFEEAKKINTDHFLGFYL